MMKRTIINSLKNQSQLRSRLLFNGSRAHAPLISGVYQKREYKNGNHFRREQSYPNFGTALAIAAGSSGLMAWMVFGR